MRVLLIIFLFCFCVLGEENSELEEAVTKNILDGLKEELKPKLSKEEVHKKLLGKWKSNKELTMKFADENAKLPQEQRLFLENIVGQMTVSYTKNSTVTSFPKARKNR